MKLLRFALPLCALTLIACGSPLVGLECRDGFESNHSQCVPVGTIIPGNDGGPDAGEGGTNNNNPDGSSDAGRDALVDLDGRIILPDGSTILPDGAIVLPDGMIIGGGNDDGGGGNNNGDAGDDDSSVTQPPVECTGPSSPPTCVCGAGLTNCSLTCVDTNTDRNNCGSCGNVCAVSELCSAGVCGPICTGTLTFCNGLCVNLDDDDLNCGMCGMVCPPLSACISRRCEGQAVGHVVAIGHDMSGPVRQPIRQIVGNAIFLAQHNPVRVLTYDAASTLASRSGVSEHIRQAAAAVGRAYTATTALPSTVTQQLGDADVFVTAPQQGSSDGDLVDLGVDWSAALDDFTFKGGVVVLFDGGPDVGDMNLGTWLILKSATVRRNLIVSPLLDVSATQFLPQRLLRLRDAADAIGSGVPTVYQSQGETVGFVVNPLATLSHNTVVIDDQGGLGASLLPVVIHVILRP